MKIEKLFHVLVVAGASSTVGLVACGSSGTGGGSGSSSGGTSSSGGSTDAGSSSGSTDGSSDASSCAAVCHPEMAVPTWIDCNGCCCWLPVGTMCAPGQTPICGNDPCCSGNGR